MRYTRITVNPAQMGDIPCIRGLRIPVAAIVGMVAENMSQRRSDFTQIFTSSEKSEHPLLLQALTL